DHDHLHSFPTRRSSDLDFVFLEEGQDPDSFLRRFGAERFQKKIAEALSLADFMIQHLARGLALDQAAGRAALAKAVSEKIRKIRSEEHTSELQSRENLV